MSVEGWRPEYVGNEEQESDTYSHKKPHSMTCPCREALERIAEFPWMGIVPNPGGMAREALARLDEGEE